MGKKRSTPDSGKKQPIAKKKKTSSSTDVTEEAFPRGGKGVLSSIEVRKIHEQVKHDLFKSGGINQKEGKEKSNIRSKKNTTPRKRSKKEQPKVDEDEVMDDSFEGIIKRLDKDAPKYAENMNYSVCLAQV